MLFVKTRNKFEYLEIKKKSIRKLYEYHALLVVLTSKEVGQNKEENVLCG